MIKQIKQQAWINRTATRAHWQAFKRRETHGCRDRMPIPHGAERSAVAKMRDDDSLLRLRRRDKLQAARDKFIRQTMKAKAPQTAFIAGARQCIGVVDEIMTAMKSGIKTANLRD